MSVLFITGVAHAQFWKGPFFWQQKPEIQERMKTLRYVPVSILRKDQDWSIKGAGRVRADASFVFDYAKDFSHLSRYTDVFSSLTWDQKAGTLEVIPKLFSGKLRAKLKIEFSEDKTEGVRRLHYKVIEGAFLGSEGALLVYEISRQECEVGLVSVYTGRIVAIGNDLLAVALEGALHSLALSMRDSVESAWQARKN